MQTIYEKELQALKPWDQVQHTRSIGRGYNKIETAGHGYLVVPRGDIFASVARKIGASFSGKTGDKCIANGNTWKESEVTPEERAKLNPKR